MPTSCRYKAKCIYPHCLTRCSIKGKVRCVMDTLGHDGGDAEIFWRILWIPHHSHWKRCYIPSANRRNQCEHNNLVCGGESERRSVSGPTKRWSWAETEQARRQQGIAVSTRECIHFAERSMRHRCCQCQSPFPTEINVNGILGIYGLYIYIYI